MQCLSDGVNVSRVPVKAQDNKQASEGPAGGGAAGMGLTGMLVLCLCVCN